MADTDPRMVLLHWAAFILGGVFFTGLAVFVVGFALIYAIVRALGRPDPIGRPAAENEVARG